MKPLFSTTFRSGMLALGLVSGLSAPSMAGPIFQPDVSLPTAVAVPEIVPVRDDWAGGNDRWRLNRNFSGARNWNRGHWNGERHWNGGNWNGGRHWNGGNWHGGRHWNGGRHWHGGGYGGYYGCCYGGGYYNDGAAALLGLGLGFGLGSLYNGYYNNGYYNNGYYGYHTQGLSSAHVRWCYNRYRSYRAWDNTFQPYNGPRHQCYSPYG